MESKKNLNKPLNENFYNKTLRQDRQQSYKLIAKFIKRITWPNINSVVEFGCGAGWFLHYLKSYGVGVLQGLEPEKSADCVRENEFQCGGKTILFDQDVRKNITTRSIIRKIDFGKKFDLAMCVEVVEHINARYANIAIQNLTRHSDLIIFSAATPGQGGYGHINEQPFGYWEERFKKQGFECDKETTQAFREYLTNKKAKKWYCNNVAVFERG